MNSLGIYFGTKDINLVEASGNKILNNIRLAHPRLETFELEEKVPADVKIVALLKEAFRSYHINVSKANFCISGQDLVIRTFEIPLLPQSELAGAVSFEAKKYIPFKLEDLAYDFQVSFNKKSKTSFVLFVGIKKEILANYVSLARQLNLEINVLEYSAFSVLRFLKLAGLSDSGVIASLCFDSNNQDEANFSVFENGFSLFSRDFDFPQESISDQTPTETDRMQRQEKFNNEIRTSLSYYNRKFPDKAVKNIFVISDKESHQGIKAFFTETAIPVKFVETQKVLGSTNNYSSILVKSFAAALFNSASLKFKIDLTLSKAKARPILAIAIPPTLFKGFKFDLRFIFLGVVVCGAVLGHGLMRTQVTQKELDAIKNKRLKVSSVSPEDDLATLSAVSSKFIEKIGALDKLVKDQMYTTPILSSIPRALPTGVWLQSFRFSQGKDTPLELVLDGGAYLEDGEQEFKLVNVFLANLKKDPVFSKNFNEIVISFVDRTVILDKDTVVFSITCKNFLENK